MRTSLSYSSSTNRSSTATSDSEASSTSLTDSRRRRREFASTSTSTSFSSRGQPTRSKQATTGNHRRRHSRVRRALTESGVSSLSTSCSSGEMSYSQRQRSRTQAKRRQGKSLDHASTPFSPDGRLSRGHVGAVGGANARAKQSS